MMLPFFFGCHDELPLDETAPTGGTDPTGGADPVYRDDLLHEVVISLDEADWAELREQKRSVYEMLGEGCMDEPWESPYTWFEAEVRFDGEELGTVGLRKKGLLGSASTTRPSLRVDVDHYVDDARFHGLEKLVFNNNNQDASRLRTCFAHHFFASTGLVAPRCSLAHVVVNGEDLGVYDNTESIDEDLVERRLGAAPATMYEGTLSDFREGWLDTFEPETDESDGADLTRVASALEAGDGTLLAELDAVLDLDAFFTFWAAESFAGHWDGYNGNTNNFYVYDPGDGRLRFIASGPDASFDSTTPFDPSWVATASALANRLIQHEEGRARFDAAMEAILAAWEVETELARIDAWKEIAREATSRDEREAMDDLRDLVERRAEDVADQLGEAVDPPALRANPCWTEVGTVTVDFSTTWGSYPGGDLFYGGEAEVYYEIQGTEYPSTADGVSLGDYGDGRAMWVTISEIYPDTWLAPYVLFEPELLFDGSDIDIDGYVAEAALLYNSPDTGGAWQTVAYLGEGSLAFSTGALEEGAEAVGRLDLHVLGSAE